MQRYRQRLLLFLLVLAVLVGNCAGGLAGRLARGLALAAAAYFQRLLQVSGIQSLNALHGIRLLSVELQAQNTRYPGCQNECLFVYKDSKKRGNCQSSRRFLAAFSAPGYGNRPERRKTNRASQKSLKTASAAERGGAIDIF